jgi:ligand-binding SRPBCC domain-containing protein
MRSFRHSFSVDAPLEKLWEFYTDIKHLEVVSPPSLGIRILKSTHQQLESGSQVWLSGKLAIRSKWHSKITSLKPYEYIDEMISGRFKVWKHLHKFQDVGNGTTKVIDEIEFELPWGAIGRLLEGYVIRQLERVFAHRKAATILKFQAAK